MTCDAEQTVVRVSADRLCTMCDLEVLSRTCSV